MRWNTGTGTLAVQEPWVAEVAVTRDAPRSQPFSSFSKQSQDFDENPGWRLRPEDVHQISFCAKTDERLHEQKPEYHVQLSKHHSWQRGKSDEDAVGDPCASMKGTAGPGSSALGVLQ